MSIEFEWDEQKTSSLSASLLHLKIEQNRQAVTTKTESTMR